MPTEIRPLPPLDRIDPSSLEVDRDAIAKEAYDQVRKDWPGIRFGKLPDVDGGGGAAAVEDPEAPLPPKWRKLGAPPVAPAAPPSPKDKVGWWKAIKGGAQMGAKTMDLIGVGQQLGALDADPMTAIETRNPMAADSMAVLPEKFRTELEAAVKKDPQKLEAERAKKIETIKAIRAEIQGMRPETDEFWKNAAIDAASSVTFMAPALGAGMVTGGPITTLGLVGMGSYYVSYANMRADGASPERASKLALVDSVTEVGTELFPTAALFKKTGVFKKILESTLADIPGELVANYVQTMTGELAKLPSDADDVQIEGAIRSAAAQVRDTSADVAAATVLGGGAQAGAVRAAQGVASLATGKGTPPAAPGAPPPAAATPAPAAPAPAAINPAATPAAPAPAAPRGAVAAPKAGDAVIFKPMANQPGVVVEVQSVDPKTRTALVAKVDPESGEAILDDEGKPLTFVATFDDMQLGPAASTPATKPAVAPTPATNAAAPAAVTPTPATPSAVPPAATTAEPTSDIAGQVKDMYRPQSKRRGVYVSPDTVAKMKAEGSYDALLRVGVVRENFDGQGGTLIVRSNKDLQEAEAARDGGNVDMQAIVGALTGAGVAKPDVPKPAVVQRKDETGAVVQQTAVSPAAAQAAAMTAGLQPGTVEVVSPEQAMAERDAKVAAEQAAAAAQAPAAETGAQPPAETRPKAKSPLAQLEDALAFAVGAMTRTKGPNSYKLDVREAAVAVGSLAQALRPAIAEAQRRGASDEAVKQAANAAKESERLTEKDETDFVKGRGVSERILRERLAALSDAVASLEEWVDRPIVNPEAAPKKSKAQIAKEKSKAKEPAKEPAKAGIVVPSLSPGRSTPEFVSTVLEPARAAVAAGNATTHSTKDGRTYSVVQVRSDIESGALALDGEGNLIGSVFAAVAELPNGRRHNADSVVDAKWRRQGVATQIYDAAERGGALFAPLSDETQNRTDDVKAFLAAREAAKRPDRRKVEGTSLRERIDAMTPEEREAAIMQHPLTGLLNRRAFEAAPEAPATAEVDADALKWINDNMGEEAGNQLLRNVATALSNQPGVTAYHTGGDEFYVTGESEAQLEAALKAAARELVGMPVKSGETLVTPQITWGVATTREAASARMKEQKVARERQGKRASRGEKPGSFKHVAQTELPLTQAAEKGETTKVSRGRTKYVPPKKREPTVTEVADQVADATAATVDVIDIVPSNTAGNEAEMLSELLGSSPSALVREAQDDPTNALARTLESIILAMKNRGNWTGWYASLTRGGIMPRETRNQLLQLIRDYADATPAEIGAIREQMLGLLTNIDGKTLPPAAISAVFEAANVVKVVNGIRERLSQDVDLNEIRQDVGGEGTFDRGMLKPESNSGMSSKTGAEVGKVRGLEPSDSNKEREVAESRNLYTALESMKAMKRPVLKHQVKLLVKGVQQDLSAMFTRAMKYQEQTGKPMMSSQAVMDYLIAYADHIGPGLESLRNVLQHVRAAMPASSLELYFRGQQMIDEHGRPSGTPQGRFYIEGWMQLAVPFSDGALPYIDNTALETFIHEALHAATIYELHRNPKGPLAQKMTGLLARIKTRARHHYGAEKVDAFLDWMDSDKSESERPPGTEGWTDYFYGLKDIFELASESLSSPRFIAFVSALDQTKAKIWYKQTWKDFWSALMTAFKIQKIEESQLLQELQSTVLMITRVQASRAKALRNHYERTLEDLQTYLGLSVDQAHEVAYASFLGADIDVKAKGKSIARQASPQGMLQDAPLGADVDFALMITSLDSAAGRADQLLETRQAGIRSDSRRDLPRQNALRDMVGPRTANAVGWLRGIMRSGTVDGLRDTGLGFLTTDHLVRRGAAMFGSSTDSTNPLVNWKNIRDTRRSFANQLLELAEKLVNTKWMKLSLTESEQVGDMLQSTTLWQIEPDRGLNQPKLIRQMGKKVWEAKAVELEKAWNKLSSEQQELYRSVQKYFKTEYARIRKAGMDLAMDLYGLDLTAQQKTLLYALKNADGAERIIGHNMPIDLGDQNETFLKIVKDLVKVSAIRGPYFPLMRKGNLVVEAAREGTLQDNGVETEFSTKEDAQAAADEIRGLAPKNSARVRAVGDKFIVTYKVRHVSFHENQTDAIEAVTQLKQQGFSIEGDVFTRKLESVESASLTEGLKELMAKAEAVAGTKGPNASAEQLAVMQNLQTAFLQILAERAASASAQLKRQGVAGFKGKEAHEIFTRRVRASSWNYANLKTSLAQSKALSRLRKFSREPAEGGFAPNMNAQQTALGRGRLMNEITRRLRVESDELNSLDRGNLDYYLGQLGFINFLATPSYAFVNSMQNFNVAMPVITGEYGPRGTRALLRGMGLVAGPAFMKAMRGLVSRPGDVTSYDVYSAIAAAVKDHPRYGKFTVPNGNEPSALQQLVDRGVINASYVQELTSIANNQNLAVTRGLEYLRLLPQGAELWNRISTALAILDVTNGNVDKAADMVDRVHFQYALENRPRFFRKIGGTRLPQSLTMFKMYSVAMYQLTGTLIADAFGRSKTLAGRRQAATALAGIIATHTLSAGLIGGVMMEPLRLLMALWATIAGDDDEFKDIDTWVQRWAVQVTGDVDMARLISKGMWNAIGFDLSDRMGLDKILMYNPPEGADESDWWKFLGQTVGGPLPAMLIQKGTAAYNKAVIQGKPLEALSLMVPVKLYQDAVKAWTIINRGVETRAGETVVPPEAFNWLDAVGRAAGFRTTEEVKTQDQGSTEFRYKKWRLVRGQQLSNRFWDAYDSNDKAAIAEATAAIEQFNRKNPGAQITSESLKASKRMKQAAAKSRSGEGRNPDLNELLAY